MKKLLIILLLLLPSLALAEVRQRGTTTTLGFSGGNITTSWPSGITNNDFCVVSTLQSPNTSTITTPSGWTHCGTATSPGNERTDIYYHTYATSDVAPLFAASSGADGGLTCLYDASGGNTLAIDGSQCEAENHTSQTTPYTPTALTASTTWEAAIGLVDQQTAATHLVGPTNFGNLQQTFSFPANIYLTNQPGSGSFAQGSWVLSGTADVHSNALLVKNAAAPVYDLRLRGMASAINSGTSITFTSPGNSGDLEVVDCYNNTASSTISAPDGTWTTDVTDTSKTRISEFSKVLGSSGGSLTFSISGGSSGLCHAFAFFDNGGGGVAVLQAVANGTTSATTFVGPALTPHTINNAIGNFTGVSSSGGPELNMPQSTFSGAYVSTSGEGGVSGFLPAPSAGSYTPPTISKQANSTGTIATGQQITFEVGETPTATPTQTPVATSTPTATATPAPGPSAVYNTTVRFVDSAGNVLSGASTGGPAKYTSTYRLVDQNGNVVP